MRSYWKHTMLSADTDTTLRGVPDWENPALLQRHRERPHVTLVPYPDVQTALAGERTASPWFKLLNGQWQLHYAPRPSAVPPAFETEAFSA